MIIFFAASFYEENQLVTKTFYIPRHFKSTWQEAFNLCHSFHMELAAFNNVNELTKFKQLVDDTNISFAGYYHVAGMTKAGHGNKTDWYWVHNQEQVNFPLDFINDEPNFIGNDQWCLAFGKHGNKYGFGDIECQYRGGKVRDEFICQVVDSVEYLS